MGRVPSSVAARIALLLALAIAGAAAEGASALRLVRCDDLVRPPTLFRATVSRTVTAEDHGRGPFVLQASLEHGSTLLASDRVELERLGQLRDGVALVLAPQALDRIAGDQPAILRVSLADAGRGLVERVEREVPTPRALARDMARLDARLRASDDRDPLPWLWAEQGAEIVTGGATAARCRQLAALVASLARHLEGGRSAPSTLRAYRCPIDGSVQPERRHGADGAPTAWLIDSPARSPTKGAWPSPPSTWLAAAAEAGTTVVECYPAGDLAWEGAALLRAEARLRAHPGRVLLVGRGTAAAGAIRLAALVPGRIAALRLIEPRLAGAALPPLPAGLVPAMRGGDEAARAWAAGATAAAPGEDAALWRFDPQQGPAEAPAPAERGAATGLASYARGPFVVVVGTGEHAAARDDARDLAQRFVVAWAMHAHGIPPRVDDTAFDERAWRGHHLVLVGSARSNAVLARLAEGQPLPVAWDSRSVRATLPDGPLEFLRVERRPLAFALDLGRGRTAVVIDGGPVWADRGLPLAGHAGPVVGEPLARAVGAP